MSTNDEEDTSGEENTTQSLASWVDSFLNREKAIRDFLSEIDKMRRKIRGK
jgi:hypothetical protein